MSRVRWVYIRPGEVFVVHEGSLVSPRPFLVLFGEDVCCQTLSVSNPGLLRSRVVDEDRRGTFCGGRTVRPLPLPARDLTPPSFCRRSTLQVPVSQFLFVVDLSQRVPLPSRRDGRGSPSTTTEEVMCPRGNHRRRRGWDVSGGPVSVQVSGPRTLRRRCVFVRFYLPWCPTRLSSSEYPICEDGGRGRGPGSHEPR